jgi:cell division protein ZipA
LDIKDLILIGGGVLVAAIVAHGLWIAWRARRDPLRLKIDEKLIASVAEREPAQADFPNGGARVVARWDEPVTQRALDLDAPGAAEPVRAEPVVAAPARPEAAAVAVHEAAGAEAERVEEALAEVEIRDAATAEGGLREQDAGAAVRGTGREPRIRATEPSVRATETDTLQARGEIRVGEAAGGKVESRRSGVARRAQEALNKAMGTRPVAKQPGNGSARSASATAGSGVQSGVTADAAPEDLILINVLAPREQPFTGPKLVDALRANGLRYGDMNIFHRIDSTTRAHQYSVANIIEPGTFDMAEVDDFRTPGVCFFMRLPGPEHPVEAFEDMHRVARDVAQRLGGELKDERRSVLTGQTVEHYRHRVAEFCRRRMSMRA